MKTLKKLCFGKCCKLYTNSSEGLDRCQIKKALKCIHCRLLENKKVDFVSVCFFNAVLKLGSSKIVRKLIIADQNNIKRALKKQIKPTMRN